MAKFLAKAKSLKYLDLSHMSLLYKWCFDPPTLEALFQMGIIRDISVKNKYGGYGLRKFMWRRTPTQ